MNIPIFKLEFEEKFIKEFQQKSREIFTSNRPIGENKFVSEFEEKFAKLVGAKYALAVTSGTAAIDLALRTQKIQGKTVFLPSNTFIATAIAVLDNEAKVSLVDIEDDDFSISPKSLRKAIDESKKKNERLGAVIIVHIGGIISSNVKEIKKICKENNMVLIEDAAQAQCSEMNGLKAGTIGKIGCFSFFPTKVMTTAEGGMLVTNDVRIFELAKSLKNFGRNPNDIDRMIHKNGTNFKISELTGLMGSMECDRVLSRIKKRNELAKIYLKRLKKSSYVPVIQKSGVCSWYKMIFKTPMEREWLRQYCKERNITLTGEVYKVPIHNQPAYEKDFKNVKLPVTDLVSKTHICPPLYPELTVEEINYICDILIQAEKDYEK